MSVSAVTRIRVLFAYADADAVVAFVRDCCSRLLFLLQAHMLHTAFQEGAALYRLQSAELRLQQPPSALGRQTEDTSCCGGQGGRLSIYIVLYKTRRLSRIGPRVSE